MSAKTLQGRRSSRKGLPTTGTGLESAPSQWTPCPPKPAELRGVFAADGKWFNPETKAEKLARVQSQVDYWGHPENGEESDHAYWNLRAWEIYRAELESAR